LVSGRRQLTVLPSPWSFPGNGYGTGNRGFFSSPRWTGQDLHGSSFSASFSSPAPTSSMTRTAQFSTTQPTGGNGTTFLMDFPTGLSSTFEHCKQLLSLAITHYVYPYSSLIAHVSFQHTLGAVARLTFDPPDSDGCLPSFRCAIKIPFKGSYSMFFRRLLGF
jgi:hypothetical protein